jgi:retron-type reverse transcriptase
MAWTSSFSERPGSHRPRRLADWLNPTGEKKVHSLVDKVYKPKNLEMAWLRVKRNAGAGGVEGKVWRRSRPGWMSNSIACIRSSGMVRTAEGKRLETEQGTPQGGVVSPVLSNILLTPFDWEMRRRGYRLTRYADDCVPRTHDLQSGGVRCCI